MPLEEKDYTRKPSKIQTQLSRQKICRKQKNASGKNQTHKLKIKNFSKELPLNFPRKHMKWTYQNPKRDHSDERNVLQQNQKFHP